MSIRNKAAIAGIGTTEYSKYSGRSALQLALEAILAALDDAGLRPSDVDGVIRFGADETTEIDLVRALGLKNFRVFHDIPQGGGATAATIVDAATVIAAGRADVLIAFRALNERSERRFGLSHLGGQVGGHWQYNLPHGFVTPAQWVAIYAQRYLYEYGYTTEEFGRVAVLCRKHAATNPQAAMYGRPITLEDHQNSRWIARPLRLLDCCLESDGAAAAVIVSAEKAKQLKGKPVYILGGAQGTGSRPQMMTSYQRESLSRLEEADATAKELYRTTGLGPRDIDVLEIYDHFTPLVLMVLESFGFAARGKAPLLFLEGHLELDGRWPLNTHGGHLGEAYIHGFNHIVEAVRQIRGTAANQVKRDVKTALVVAGTGVPTSAVILAKEAY